MRIYKSKWVKVTYAVLLALLVGLEVAAISNDRFKQNETLRKDRETQSIRFERTMANFANLQKQINEGKEMR